MSKDNKYKMLRESTETDEKKALTQEELVKVFENEGNPLRQSTISKIETCKKEPASTSVDVLKAYTEHFHVTSDYLLGLAENKYADENHQMITRITGLSDESIDILKSLRQGNEMDSFFETLNYLISKDFTLFSRFIDAIGMYFDEGYDTPMRWNVDENRYVPLDDGLSNNPIVKVNEKSVLIGKYDQSLCNNLGGYSTRALPISVLKESYSMYCIQIILEELKREKDN